MTRSNTIACDTCGKNIATTSNCEDWRISLRNEPVPSQGGVVTLMASYPHLYRGSADFCCVPCLQKYMAANYPTAAAP